MCMSQNNSQLPFLLSFIGGLLIFVGGIVSSIWFIYGGTSWGDYSNMWYGMMGGYHGMMGSFGFPLSSMGVLSLVGLVSGILVILAAIMLNIRPHEKKAWGLLIIIFSALSFLNMGGFVVGAVLGLVGGAFAVSSNK